MGKRCPGKVRYRDRIAALLALSEVGRKGRDESRAYPCPHCRGWHLTSKALTGPSVQGGDQ